MGYHPRIETTNIASFITTRSRNSELWFINNSRLTEAILGYVAKYSKRYKVVLYGFAIEGNHNHVPALFPKANRAHFMRDLNSSIARAVHRHVSIYPGGRFWGKRYSNEFLPNNEDIEKEFFYTVLQPVSDGLVSRISEYPGYNCFHDAVWGIKRKYKVVNWAKYNDRKRWDSTASIKDYTEIVELEYARLPGYEHLSQKEYAKLMHEKLEEKRLEIVEQRRRNSLSFVGRKKLLKAVPGSIPKKSKKIERYDHRPRILSNCPKKRKIFTDWYFDIYYRYKAASAEYRSGNLKVVFPPGTYKPPLFTVGCTLDSFDCDP